MFGKKIKKHQNPPYSTSQDRGEPDGGYEGDNREEQDRTPPSNSNSSHEEANGQSDGKYKLTFHCQQAQGSPTGIISNFANVKQLYDKIAICYDMKPSDVSIELNT